jgi:hypothetical protein
LVLEDEAKTLQSSDFVDRAKNRPNGRPFNYSPDLLHHAPQPQDTPAARARNERV